MILSMLYIAEIIDWNCKAWFL